MSDGGQQHEPGRGPSRRDSVVDRRSGVDRRDDPLAGGQGADAGFDRRRGPGRRRSDFTKAAEEGELNREQFLFVQAIEAFKRANGKTFPTWTDVLEVIRLLGYRKTAPSEVALRNAQDWTEKPDAPSSVKARHRDRDDEEAEELAG